MTILSFSCCVSWEVAQIEFSFLETETTLKLIALWLLNFAYVASSTTWHRLPGLKLVKAKKL